MPTKNPRINVTLSPSMDNLVAKLASLERVSKSMVLRELLEAAEPALASAVALMEAAQGASQDARNMIVRDMQSTIDAANGVLHLTQSVAVARTRDIVAQAEAIRGRRPSRTARASGARVKASDAGEKAKRPPSSNRGVKS